MTTAIDQIMGKIAPLADSQNKLATYQDKGSACAVAAQDCYDLAWIITDNTDTLVKSSFAEVNDLLQTIYIMKSNYIAAVRLFNALPHNEVKIFLSSIDDLERVFSAMRAMRDVRNK